MKKLILTITAVVGGSIAGYSQGASLAIGNSSANANGYVISSSGKDTSTTATTYVQAPTFTIQLYALPGNVETTSGLTADPIDAYGYLQSVTAAGLTADGFVQVANEGNTTGSAGVFNQPTFANIIGSTGAFPYSTTAAGAADVVALVGWTGTAATLTAAIAGGANVGAIVMVSALGPGGTNPNVPNIYTAWNALANSPLSAAKGDTQDFILSPVPEPTTLALAGLGGAALLAFRRKKA